MSVPDVDGGQPALSICVPVWRRHPSPNLASLLREIPAAAGGRSLETIVVLNGISPQAAGVAPGARVVAFERNRGVPVAWNAAARLARGEILVMINDDVSLGAGSLAMLKEALDDDNERGVVGPVGTRWDIGVPRHLEYVDLTGMARGTAVDCDVVSGFLFATRRETWEAVGGFDESYSPCGFEEVDYCTAVRRTLGRRASCIAGVPAEHEFGISATQPWRRVRWDGRSERLDSIDRRNREHFRAKWSVASVGDGPLRRERP